MKNNPILITFTIAAALTASGCARKDNSAAADPQQAPEPVRESAWKPASYASGQPQATQPPSQLPVQAQQPPPAPIASNTPPPAPFPAASQPPAPAPSGQYRPMVPTAQPMQVTLAAGSIITARINETLTSERNQSGDAWSGTLNEPIVIDGMVIAARGSRVEGRITNLKRAGRVKGVATLTVAVTGVQTADGQMVALQTSGITHVGKDETKRDVGKVAIATGIGAAIGAIAGGGKGAGIGAGAGAAAGTGTVMVMRGGPAVVASESVMRFRVQDPVTIVERIR